MISRRAMMNDEIVSKSGELLQLEKCKGSYLNGLKVFGKSTQRKTTGANLLDPQKYKLGESNGVTYTLGESGRIIANGTSTGSDVANLGDLKDVLQDGKRYIANCQCYQVMLDGTRTYSRNFTFDKANMVSVIPYIQIGKGNTVVNKVYEPMVNEGDVVKPWEPYTGGKPSPSPEYPQDIVNAGKDGSVGVSVSGKNLLPFVVGDKGEGFEVFEDGVFINGKKGTDFYAVGSSDSTSELSYKNMPELTPGDYYMINNTKEVYFFCVVWRNGTNNVIGSTSDSNSIKVTFQKGDKFRIFFRIMSETFTGKVKAMITRELVSLDDYEPYRSQKLILSTSNGLAGIPVKSGGNYTDSTGQRWVCDEIDLSEGVKVQRVAEHIFNEKDRFNYTFMDAGNISRFSWLDYIDLAAIETPVICEKFRYLGYNTFTENGITGSNGYARCFMYIDPSIDTVEKFKEIIIGTKILYVLADPIITPLTPEEIAAYKALHTYAPTTVVTNNADAGMEVSYRKVRG